MSQVVGHCFHYWLPGMETSSKESESFFTCEEALRMARQTIDRILDNQPERTQ